MELIANFFVDPKLCTNISINALQPAVSVPEGTVAVIVSIFSSDNKNTKMHKSNFISSRI